MKRFRELDSGKRDESEPNDNDVLPGWYGTGVTPPTGHDGHFTFETTDRYVKFVVLATVDLDVDWP